ncbi:MAG: hypothetical protein ACXWVD_00045 [Telluria sp.]
MALNTQLANATVNAQADALSALLDNGYLRIYDGTQPATADTAVSTQTLLAELRFNADAAPAASGGLLTFNALTSDSSANATGTAAWFRALASDGTTVVMDGSVGTSAANMIIATTSISAGQTVSCSSFTHDVLNSSSGL